MLTLEKNSLVVVAQAFNPNLQRQLQVAIWEFEASLVTRAVPGYPPKLQRNPVSKKKKNQGKDRL